MGAEQTLTALLTAGVSCTPDEYSKLVCDLDQDELVEALGEAVFTILRGWARADRSSAPDIEDRTPMMMARLQLRGLVCTADEDAS